MIVKSDIGHLPDSLRAQFSNGVGRSHPLWRIASQGLNANDLAQRIEFIACTGLATTEERSFKLNLADTDPLAVQLNELASRHKLAKSRVFEILVKLGWESLQAYGTQLGGTPAQPQPMATRPAQQAMASGAPAQRQEPATTAPQPATTHAQPIAQKPEPEFSDTPEFADIANNMLAQFGIDMGIATPAQQ